MGEKIRKNIELLFVELAATNRDGYVCLNIDYLLIFNQIRYTNIIKKAFLLLADESGIIHADGENEILTVFESLRERFQLPFWQEDGIVYVYPDLENIFEIQGQHTEEQKRDIHLLALLINGEVNRLNQIPGIIQGYMIYQNKEKRRELWKS